MGIWDRFKSCGWIWGLVAAVLCFAAGAWQGQFAVIWKKAVLICLECIGIG